MANLDYTRGTTFQMTFNYTPPPGGADGATAFFTVKSQIDNDATDLQDELMAPKDIAMTANSCVIEIQPGDVNMSHDAGTDYVWDIKVLDADGKIYPGVSGTFRLDVTATNRITA